MSSKVIYGGERTAKFINASLGRFLFDTATKYSERVCQIDGTLDLQETYGSFKSRSVKLAISLKNQYGALGKAPVLICSKNTLDNGIVIAACSYLGYIWGNLEPSLSIALAKYLIALTKPKLIFVEESAVNLIEQSLEDTNNIEVIVIGDSQKYKTFAELVSANFPEDEKRFSPVDVNPNDLAFFLFSSGSTGLPKAICHSGSSLINSCRPSFLNAKVFFHTSHFYWVTAIIGLTDTFMAGGCRVFIHHEFDGEDLFRMIEKYKITSIFASHFLTYKITESRTESNKYDTSSLTHCTIGGSKIAKQHLFSLYETFKKKLTIVYLYGMTEIGMIANYLFNRDNEESLIPKLESCGKLNQGIYLKVRDPTTGEAVGANQVGEICLKPTVSLLGYFNNPEGSKDIWDDEGFVKTGDLGYYDQDHFIYLQGRLKEMFKYRSWPIVPAVIEQIIEQHPAVKESVVVGIPKGELGEEPAACIILKTDYEDVSADEIAKFVEGKVADREKLGGGVWIVKEVPRTPTGKISRTETRKMVLETLLRNGSSTL